jgi:hypothetical protein
MICLTRIVYQTDYKYVTKTKLYMLSKPKPALNSQQSSPNDDTREATIHADTCNYCMEPHLVSKCIHCIHIPQGVSQSSDPPYCLQSFKVALPPCSSCKTTCASPSVLFDVPCNNNVRVHRIHRSISSAHLPAPLPVFDRRLDHSVYSHK